MEDSHGSRWTVSVDPETRETKLTVVLTEATRMTMHADRVALLDRAGDLIRRAFEEPGEPTTEGEIRRAARQAA